MIQFSMQIQDSYKIVELICGDAIKEKLQRTQKIRFIEYSSIEYLLPDTKRNTFYSCEIHLKQQPVGGDRITFLRVWQI